MSDMIQAYFSSIRNLKQLFLPEKILSQQV